ncbi:hypothetical protein BKA57DRAFT_456716 [Linnemannia elongata]|nr:hypothetical protein BKA57DRAFT_456716 [Linnemannia elongata]
MFICLPAPGVFVSLKFVSSSPVQSSCLRTLAQEQSKQTNYNNTQRVHGSPFLRISSFSYSLRSIIRINKGLHEVQS